MSKSKKKQFEKLLQKARELASLRAQEAVKRGVTFEYFKHIADNADMPEYGSVLAGNIKTGNVKTGNVKKSRKLK